MSIDFTGVKAVTVPEGAVKKITRKSDGVVLWEKSLLPAKDTLENTSWADIQTVSKAGLASEYWSVGDQKTIYVNGVAYLVDIIGFDHDTPTNTSTYGRTKAGITFQLHDVLATTYKMNDSNTNSGGWKSSVMRTSTMPTLLNQLASDLKAVIVPVDKISGKGGGSSSGTASVSDSLFLLAEGEVFGSSYGYGGNGYSFDDECSSVTQYAYYKNGGSKKKYKSGSAWAWWLRSPPSRDSTRFCRVDSVADASRHYASHSYGVSFGFCV